MYVVAAKNSAYFEKRGLIADYFEAVSRKMRNLEQNYFIICNANRCAFAPMRSGSVRYPAQSLEIPAF
jgi:hypothetical protein